MHIAEEKMIPWRKNIKIKLYNNHTIQLSWIEIWLC